MKLKLQYIGINTDGKQPILRTETGFDVVPSKHQVGMALYETQQMVRELLDIQFAMSRSIVDQDGKE